MTPTDSVVLAHAVPGVSQSPPPCDNPLSCLFGQSEHKWKQLAELATAKCQFGLAQECLHRAQDYGGLLLLATASGNANMVGKLAEGAERDGKTNVAFLTSFLQGR